MFEWKYFIPKDPENIKDLKELRHEFPNYYFLKGNHKGVRGCFAVKDLKNKTYGEKTVSSLNSIFKKKGFIGPDDTVYFWEPAVDRDNFDISQFEKKSFLPKIPVNLTNGMRVRIIPAAGVPEEMLFGEEEEDEERLPFAKIFSKSNEYGKLAYDLIYLEDELNDSGGIPMSDIRVKKFIRLALLESYDLPADIWKYLGLTFNVKDTPELYKAGLGADQGFLDVLRGGQG